MAPTLVPGYPFSAFTFLPVGRKASSIITNDLAIALVPDYPVKQMPIVGLRVCQAVISYCIQHHFDWSTRRGKWARCLLSYATVVLTGFRLWHLLVWHHVGDGTSRKLPCNCIIIIIIRTGLSSHNIDPRMASKYVECSTKSELHITRPNHCAFMVFDFLAISRLKSVKTVPMNPDASCSFRAPSFKLSIHPHPSWPPIQPSRRRSALLPSLFGCFTAFFK